MNILKFKNDVIPYTVNKAVSGALCICVDGNEVVVNAPWYVSKKHIQEVINRNNGLSPKLKNIIRIKIYILIKV